MTLTISDILWENDYEKFIGNLNASAITEVHVTDTSTALLGTLHLLLNNGWRVTEATTTTIVKWEDTEVTKKGIMFRRAR